LVWVWNFINYNKVRSIAGQVIHLQFDNRANALEIRAIQSPKYV
jgi:hypothetical protein